MLKLFNKSEFIPTSQYRHDLFVYRNIHKKIGEVLESVFGGYSQEKYIFYPPADELDDYFSDIRLKILVIDNKPEFDILPITIFRQFKLSSNYKDMTRLWEHLKKAFYEDDKMLTKNTQFDYYLPDDLQVAFNKIDELIKVHTEEKNKVLKANHIYPTSKYFGILVNKKSFRRDLLKYLSENDQKNINIQMISDKFKKDLAYVWIVINQLNKMFEKKQITLKIVSENNHIHLITS